MRALKWVASIAIVIVLIAIIVHLRRDSIARDIANSILEEQGFIAAELAVESLSPSRLDLELLVIESDSGARYEIAGLSVPLNVKHDETMRVSADSLAISYATERDRQTMLSTTLETIFGVPLPPGGVEARIDSIVLPKVPEIRNADLQAGFDGLTLTFSINDIQLAAGLKKGTAGSDVLVVGAVHDDNVVMNLDLDFTRRDDRYNATGEVSASLAAWLPTLQELRLVPPGLQRLDVSLDGQIDLQFDEDAPGRVAADLNLAVQEGSSISYRVDSDRATNYVTASADTLVVEFDYPANDWRSRVANISGVFDTDGLSKTPVALANVDCEKGIVCTLDAIVDSQALTWNDYTVAAGSFTLPLTVRTGDITRVQVAPEASGEFTGLQSEGINAALVTVTGFSGTEIVIDDGWRCRIDELQLAFNDFAASEDLLVSPGVTLEELIISASGQSVNGNIAVSGPFDGAWKNIALSLPGAAGTFSFRNEELHAAVDIVDLNDAAAGSIQWSRNAAADTGSLEVRNGWASFDRARLSDYLPGPTPPVDILQGHWDIDLQLQWEATNGIPQYRGTAAMTLNGIGGTYTDIAIIGLTTDLSALIDPVEGLVFQPEPVSTRLLDLGVPIENIGFQYKANLDDQIVSISGLSFDIFGGRVSADPFEYALASATTEVMLYARDIQLQLMVDTLEFESLALTGTVSGELPVTITDKTITVNSGRMASDSAGTIRYQSAVDAPDSTDQEVGLGAILQTLKNFEYESLSSTIDYTEGGDMKLLMRIVGTNPDIDPDQPYAFNLNLENNIPQMLRSLRAVRSIEDILKQQTEN